MSKCCQLYHQQVTASPTTRKALRRRGLLRRRGSFAPKTKKTCRLALFAVGRFPAGHPDLIDPTRKAWNMENEWASKVWRVRERHEPDQDDTCVFTLQTHWNMHLMYEADSHSNRPNHDPHQRIPATHFAQEQERSQGPPAEGAKPSSLAHALCSAHSKI